MKHQDKPKSSLRARLRRAFCEVTGTQSRMEIVSGSGMLIRGCCGIEVYEPSCIVLRLRDPELRWLRVCGQELLCSSYHADGVEISGCIGCVELCREARIIGEISKDTR